MSTRPADRDLDDLQRSAWALVRAQDEGDHHLLDELVDTVDDDYGLVQGLEIVAAVLLDGIRRHAAVVGCNCGSTEWLDRTTLQLALVDHDEQPIDADDDLDDDGAE